MPDLFTDQHRIAPVADSKVYLSLNSNKTDNGTEIWLWNNAQHPAAKWYLSLFDGGPLNCPDVGKGN